MSSPRLRVRLIAFLIPVPLVAILSVWYLSSPLCFFCLQLATQAESFPWKPCTGSGLLFLNELLMVRYNYHDWLGLIKIHL